MISRVTVMACRPATRPGEKRKRRNACKRSGLASPGQSADLDRRRVDGCRTAKPTVNRQAAVDSRRHRHHPVPRPPALAIDQVGPVRNPIGVLRTERGARGHAPQARQQRPRRTRRPRLADAGALPDWTVAVTRHAGAASNRLIIDRRRRKNSPAPRCLRPGGHRSRGPCFPAPSACRP